MSEDTSSNSHEKIDNTIRPSLLDQAESNASQLHLAYQYQCLASNIGFDWPDISGVIAKIHEELDEVMAESDRPDNQHQLLNELGDLLFACVNLARHLNVDPDHALAAANAKFYRRFYTIEQHVNNNNKEMHQCSLDELDALWDIVKKSEN